MSDALMPIYDRVPINFTRGEGCWLIDQAGNRYLDFAAGIAVNVLGHCHPALVAALQAQSERLWHTSNLYEIERQNALAERLVEATFGDTVFFTNSGTESCELVVKLVRKHFFEKGQPERHVILTFDGAFHGRSGAAIAAAGSDKMTHGFGPLLPGFRQLPFADHDALREAITPDVAAILVEPIQGEGGIRPLPGGCLEGIRALCDEHGILLVFDEVQCGMGRTGTLFAYQQTSMAPDVMMIAKGLGGGFPVGAVISTKAAASGMTLGTHGSTYGGNPLACAVGCAVMEQVTASGFLPQVADTAAYFERRLGELVAQHRDAFAGSRGIGMMRGLLCELPNKALMQSAMNCGLLTVPAADNVLRLLPPLIAGRTEIDLAIDRLSTAAKAMN